MANNHALYYFRKSNNMAYSVDLIYSKNQDYTNPQTVTEAGKPSTIDLENLDSNQTYYAKAVLKNDGTVEDEDTYTFTTLPAGTIALTHQSSTRQGSNYVVVYTYTSTYALSSSILRCGASIAVQGVIAGNTITYTISGLTPGVSYNCEITTIDIYAESQVDPVTLVMPVVNTFSISTKTVSETFVTLNLDYTLDGGFANGSVEYWLATQNPDTDTPQYRFYFDNGDTTVDVTGLTAATAYKFRGKIVLSNWSTEVYSNVVTESTSAGVLGEYFSLNNLGGETAEFSIITAGTVSKDINYSLDDGETWTAYDLSTLPVVSVGAGKSVKLRGRNNGGIGTSPFSSYNIQLHMNKSYSVTGNPSSLVDPEPAVFATYTNFPAMGRLFQNETNLVDASGLETSQYTQVGDFHFYRAFEGSGLQRPPSFSGVTLIKRSGMERAFYGCSALAEATDLSSLVELRGEHALLYTYKNCTSLTTGSNLHSLTTISNNGGMVEGMYESCTSLVTAYSPKLTTWNENYFRNWLNGVSASGEVCVPTGMSLNIIPTDTVNGVPNGWWAHYC